MKIEIIKTPTGFRIPQLENMDLPLTRIVAEVNPAQFKKESDADVKKSRTISALGSALKRLGGNNLLALKLKHMPVDFTFSETESDAAALGRALMEKYDV